MKQIIQELLGLPIENCTPLSGTNFTESFKLETAEGSYFLKYSEEKTEIFHREANSLRKIKSTGAIDVAHVVAATEHFLLLDFIEVSRPQRNFFSHFGESLAELHKHTSSQCGFFEDNFLGATPQPNTNPNDLPWPSFFWEKRLLYQCQLGVKNGFIAPNLKKKIFQMKSVVLNLLHTEEPPSLLHGDLWNGWASPEKWDMVLSA
ncbi:MAG: fructosamine kinase family protein [Bacteriovoracales bacterium]|nr:fructosamine kinase family protein [Bacteriovoracales bacterium]